MPWTLVSNLKGPPGEGVVANVQNLVITTTVRDPDDLSIIESDSKIAYQPFDVDRIP